VEEELALSLDSAVTPRARAPPISAHVTDGRGSFGGRHTVARGGRGGRGPLPSKWSACGSLDQILSFCTISDDALLKWIPAKRLMIVRKYGAPSGPSSHNALLTDVHHSDAESDAPGAGPFEMKCTSDTMTQRLVSPSTMWRSLHLHPWAVTSPCLGWWTLLAQ
jgi:hypothetical protein